jgi:hypothetical protein
VDDGEDDPQRYEHHDDHSNGLQYIHGQPLFVSQL